MRGSVVSKRKQTEKKIKLRRTTPADRSNRAGRGGRCGSPPIARMARLVNNHSSVAPGLAPVLKTPRGAAPGDGHGHARAAREDARRGTRFSRVTFGASGPELSGFKLIARKGKSTQEVFVTSKLSREEMEAHVGWCVNKVHG